MKCHVNAKAKSHEMSRRSDSEITEMSCRLESEINEMSCQLVMSWLNCAYHMLCFTIETAALARERKICKTAVAGYVRARLALGSQ